MAERSRIVAELKRALRAGGHTYADVARRLELSVASVKRLFSQEDLTLERIDRICELAGLGLSEILERAASRAVPTRQLTLAQEGEIVADPALLFMTWLVLIRTPFEDIIRDYRFTEQEALKQLIRLDRLKVIELQPGNRVRLLVSRHFSWRPGGPVQRYIVDKVLHEFFASRFAEPEEEFLLHGGRMSRKALAEIKRVLQDAARDCATIIERDRPGDHERVAAAWVLALRPFTFRQFRQFDRAQMIR
ncbi:MAG TPA: helix-turn-helix transcriptional regulator [Steroidobacteraceae bacterium]|nr:helix-turn-helix transcriptional regulator [Steroidobacteraceae bacterium]